MQVRGIWYVGSWTMKTKGPYCMKVGEIRAIMSKPVKFWIERVVANFDGNIWCVLTLLPSSHILPYNMDFNKNLDWLSYWSQSIMKPICVKGTQSYTKLRYYWI
jgi:hypothetical protein